MGHRITGRYPGAVNRHHGIGWEFVHVCIDDASRIAFVQVMADQRKESAVACGEAAVAYFAGLGIRIDRVLTDNGSPAHPVKGLPVQPANASVFAKSSPGHIPPRPTAKPNASSKQRYANGLTRARAYENSDQRSAELLKWLHPLQLASATWWQQEI